MKIICIAHNFAAHTAESSAIAEHTSPVWYTKPDTALLRNNDPFYIPSFDGEFVPEFQMVVKINKVGKSVSEKFASRYYDEVGVGVNFTPRNARKEAVGEGLPWEMHSAFDHSSAVSLKFLSLAALDRKIGDAKVEMQLGDEHFCGDYSLMRFSVDSIIAELSRMMTLKIGDLIYMGVPCDVRPVREGDNIRVSLFGEELLNFDIR